METQSRTKELFPRPFVHPTQRGKKNMYVMSLRTELRDDLSHKRRQMASVWSKSLFLLCIPMEPILVAVRLRVFIVFRYSCKVTVKANGVHVNNVICCILGCTQGLSRQACQPPFILSPRDVSAQWFP